MPPDDVVETFCDLVTIDPRATHPKIFAAAAGRSPKRRQKPLCRRIKIVDRPLRGVIFLLEPSGSGADLLL